MKIKFLSKSPKWHQSDLSPRTRKIIEYLTSLPKGTVVDTETLCEQLGGSHLLSCSLYNTINNSFLKKNGWKIIVRCSSGVKTWWGVPATIKQLKGELGNECVRKD